MLYEAFLVLLDLISMASCCHGVYVNSVACKSVVCFLYGGIIWFALSGSGSLASILDIVMNSWSSDVTLPRKNIYLQFHYFLAWIALIVGYPLFVTAMWLSYCPSLSVHLHLLLAALPLLIWSVKAEAMVKVTEVCMLICIVSHFYISVLSGNAWCLIGAFIMAMKLFFLNFSHYSFFGIHSKEAFIISSAVAYYVLSRAIQAMSRCTQIGKCKL